MDRGTSGSVAQSDIPRSPTSNDAIEEIPACQSCRKRKLKCSREFPSCSQCSRLSCICIYEHKKQKPGLRSGAVENLNRRLEVLERLLLDGNGDPKSPHARDDAEACSRHASLLIANELKKAADNLLGSGCQDGHASYCDSPEPPSLNGQRRTSVDSVRETSNESLSRKRKRPGNDTGNAAENWNAVVDSVATMPPHNVMEAIIETYFAKIHHWIPFLHQKRFKTRLKDHDEDRRLRVLLHAMVSATMRHVPVEKLGLSDEERERQVRVSRSVVMLNAMEVLSVENLQALIIIAFDNMGGGKLPNAWSIIGSLTRTVEYLQLTIESDKTPRQSLLAPLVLLESPTNPAEIEERRRVFWNVFLLDRFCSATSGWNTSLTSDDVRRRLPCNGKLWAAEEQTMTPFFGIWDKSAAKIGNSVAYMPAPRASHPSPNDHDNVQNSSPAGSASVETSNIGAFAYRIEAAESLSQVTSFFLQQRVDFRNRQEVSSWLTRFKELDLRLVHWKLFLPQKWKDSNVSGDDTFIKMDPNLTLAHLTHNIAMILLHQHIAYPPSDLTDVVKLPSSCSAETCQLAAVETASIAQKYLRYTEGLVPSQFAFCAFVAARVLLVHCRFYNAELAPEFFNLIDSLQVMSRRWQGDENPSTDNNSANVTNLNAAAKYAIQLQRLHAKCLDNVNFCTEILGCPDPTTCTPERNAQDISMSQGTPSSARGSISHPRTTDGPSLSGHGQQFPTQSLPAESPQGMRAPDLNGYGRGRHQVYQSQPATSSNSNNNHVSYLPREDAVRMATPAVQNLSTMGPSITTMGYATEPTTTEDELTAMSHLLLGQQFSELDRVITLDGTDFAFDMSSWGNIS